MKRARLGLLLLSVVAGCNRNGSIEGDAEGECSDEVDNDQNGKTDCDDPGCKDALACTDPDTDEPVDADGDGFVAEEDCDDADAAVNPDAEEIPWDGIDQDCDEATPDDDLDGDGLGIAEDCDEGDSTVGGDAAAVCRALGAETARLSGVGREHLLGAAVVIGPDVDGDGTADLVAGAPGVDSYVGSLYVMDGAAMLAGGDFSVEDALATVTGHVTQDRVGTENTVVALPDGGGVLAGVPFSDPGGFGNAGEVHLLRASDLASSGRIRDVASVTMQGRAVGDRFGAGVGASDIDGDGIVDIVASSPQDDGAAANAGLVVAFWGADLTDGTISVVDADLQLSGVFNERMGDGGQAVTGDFDGDGNIELAIGSSTSDAAGRNEPGVVYLVDPSGVTSGAIVDYADATLVGDAEGDLFGSRVASPGDWDGDGADDLFVTALRGEDTVTNEGTLGLWWGGGDVGGTLDASTADLQWSGGLGLARAGAELQVVDADGDATADIAVATPYRDGSSQAYVLQSGALTGGALADDASMWFTAAPPQPSVSGLALGQLGTTNVAAVGATGATTERFANAGAVYLFTLP